MRMSPQQFSARQMLKPTALQGNISANTRYIRQNSQTNNSTEQLHVVDSASGSPRKADDQPRDQLTTLETQLQSKEARLNWMLEAVRVVAGSIPPTKERLMVFVMHRRWKLKTQVLVKHLPVLPQLREILIVRRPTEVLCPMCFCAHYMYC